METTLLQQASAALRKAALNEEAKNYVLSNPALLKILKRAADRYIGGETLEETVNKVILQNNQGFKCSIEYMGESTHTLQEADAARNEFVNICRTIKRLNLNATISLDLSHIGLVISPDLCLHNLQLICDEALPGNIEVIISAENTDRTDAVLSTYKAVAGTYPNVGITLQSYLYRTAEDLEELLKYKGRIRVVKGAFETTPGLAMQRGSQLDQAYLDYVDRLLSANHLCSIATHDKIIQEEVKKLIQKRQPSRNSYEFESLFGIQHEQLQELKADGHSAKIYFVYGREWYLYLCNRLAEYPLNVFQALVDMVV
jgi:proline dehydrogenase